MAPPSRIEGHLERYQAKGLYSTPGQIPEVPEFFERKRLEEELTQERDFITAVLDTEASLVVVLDVEGRIVRFNKACEQVTGFTAKDVAGKQLWDVLLAAEDVEAVRRVFDDLRALNGRSEHENYWLTKEGGKRMISWHNSVLRDSNGSVSFVIGTGIDVTLRRQLEVDLRHAQKLEAVGKLASGVAHEINTPTQFIGDSLEFLKEAFEDLTGLTATVHRLCATVNAGGDRKEAALALEEAEDEADLDYLLENVPPALERMADGVGRIAEIVSAMKEFGHPGQGEQAAADLNRALSNTLTVARNEYKYIADLETDFGELPLVLCQISDINQAFLNIVVNASHAVEDAVAETGGKGRITVRTRVADGKVRVEISDTGAGIPEELRQRVFDPFFTTKEVGRGTGQGLAIARSIIVDKHGGELTCKSIEGQGTTFVIQLPAGLEPRPSSTD